ncbi:MAG: hypothetical protein ABEL76_00360 [Bradymonadaceae bacterium]
MVRLSALGSGEDDGRGGKAPDRWVAIRLPGTFREPPSTVVAAPSGCRLGFDNGPRASVDVLRRDLTAPSHPLKTTVAAFKHGADALASCGDDGFHFATPVLFRKTQRTFAGDYIGPPLFGSRGLEAKKLPPEGRARALAAAAAASTGDPILADFHLDSLIRSHPDAIPDDLLLAGMQVAAAAGRPEAGLRRGWYATASSWTRSNEPRYKLGRAAAAAAFGQPDRQLSLLRNLRNSADQNRWRATTAWLDLRAARAATSRTGEIYSLFEKYQKDDRGRWAALFALAAGARAGDHSPNLKPKVRRVTREHGAGLLFDVVGGGEADSTCRSDGACPLDVYGRRLRATLKRVEKGTVDLRQFQRAVVRLGRSTFRPGFSKPLELAGLDSTAARFETGLVLAPRTSGTAADELARATSRRAGLAIEQGIYCGDSSVPPWIARYLESTVGDGDGATSLLAWLAGDGLKLACRAPAEAARTLEERVGEDGSGVVVAGPLFAKLATRLDSPDRRRDVFEAAFAAARRHGPARTCRNTGLALAASDAVHGNLEQAEAQLNETVNCPGTGPEQYRRTRGIVRGYIRFQRDSALPRQLSDDAEAALERVYHLPRRGELGCAGIDSLSFDLLAELPDDVVELTRQMTDGGRRRDETESGRILKLRTADRRLAAAQRSLKRTYRALRDGRFEEAARALEKAHGEFVALRHRTGLGRVALLSKAVFGVEPGGLEGWKPPEGVSCAADGTGEDEAASAPATAEELRCSLSAGRAGELTGRLSNVDPAEASADVLRSLVAASLVADRTGPIEGIVESDSGRKALGAFCEPRD